MEVKLNFSEFISKLYDYKLSLRIEFVTIGRCDF